MSLSINVSSNLTDNAKKVLEKRYLKKDLKGRIVETPEELFRRVAANIAQADLNYGTPAGAEEAAEEFYSAMANLEFLPNSPTLMNAGRDLQQLAACFVLPIEDSMESIFETLKNTSLIHKSGGGTGFSFARLRPKSSQVKTTGGVASGPVSFLKVFDAATQAVKQGGCVDYNTIISTSKGLKPISGLGRIRGVGYQDISLAIPTDNGTKTAEQWYNNGVKVVKTITTRDGYSFTGTLNHKIRVIDEDGNYVWKRLIDVRRDDWVVLQKDTFMGDAAAFPKFNREFHFNVKSCRLPEKMNRDLAELFGYYVGDGCYYKGKLMLAIPHDSIELKNHFDEIVRQNFEIDSRYEQKPNDKSINNIYHSKMLVEWLKFIGVDKTNSVAASIPKIILEGDRTCAEAFLRGLFEADGSMHEEGYPSLYSISEDLIKEVQILLLSLGIPSRISVNRERGSAFGKNFVYCLRIVTPEGTKLFKERVGFISKEKRAKLDYIKHRSFSYNDIITNQSQKFREFYESLAIGPRNDFYRKIYHYLSGIEDARSLTRQRAQTLTSEYPFLKESFLGRLISRNQYYDQVKDMRFTRTLTLDLVVPDTHTYIANGFVSHNTRRGANMGILRVDHPDILEFIACKESDKDITNFNISVTVTDEFMTKVETNDDYELIDPHTHKPIRKLKAREVFNKIVKMAWKNGEPGLIFIDKMNAQNPTPEVGLYESTNPCVTGDTLVSTEFGLMKIKDIAEECGYGGLRILTDDRAFEAMHGGSDGGGVLMTQSRAGVSLNTISKTWRTGLKPTFKLTTKCGYELTATGDHRIMTTEGWTQVKDLKIGEDRVLIQSASGTFNRDDRLPFYYPDLPRTWSKELGHILGSLISDKGIVSENEVSRLLYGSKHVVEFFKKLGVRAAGSDNKEVPELLFTATEDAVTGFLQTLFSADGTVRENPKSDSAWIALTSESKKLLQGVQALLLNLGIKSGILDRSRKSRDGMFEYVDKEGKAMTCTSDGVLYELGIFGVNREIFRKKINFLNTRERQKLESIKFKTFGRPKFYDEVLSVEEAGVREVFDLTEPVTHSMIVNGIVAHQCGEQVLLPYESCNLGSINLSKMVTDGEIDWNRLSKTVETAVHFLDNVIDMNKFPLEKIEEMTKANRKIGLGVMGFADMLIELGIPYNSEEAVFIADKVMSFILSEGRKASSALAGKRGAFPNFEKSVYKKEGGPAMRNATITTIAPTGTLSIIAGCSSGIEPLFALVYYKEVMDKDRLAEVNTDFENAARENGFYSKALMEKVAKTGGIQELDEVPEEAKRTFITSHDISPEWHIRIQAAFQKYTDNAVSKTINFPQEAAISDVEKAYKLAYRLNCKGVTIYRDKSREEQVLNVGGAKPDKAEPKAEAAGKILPKPRPMVISGTTTKIGTGCGNLYVTINEDSEGHPFEVFMQMGKAGGCAASQLEAMGRLLSLAFRSSIDIKAIVDQLRGIRCPSPSWEKGGRIFSCSDAIARVIEKRLCDKKEAQERPKKAKAEQETSFDNYSGRGGVVKFGNVVGVCPDCGGALRHVEGCQVCRACGYSKCG